MANRIYSIRRVVLPTEGDTTIDITVPEGVTPLITPDGGAIVVVEDVTEVRAEERAQARTAKKAATPKNVTSIGKGR